MAIGLVMSALLSQSAPLASYDRFVTDLRLSRLAPSMALREDVVVIAVTEDTLDRFAYRSPVDRAFLAALVGDLDRRGAEVIALDILLDKPTTQAADAALSEAFAAAGADIVLVDFPSADPCGRSASAPARADARVLPRFSAHAVTGDGTLCVDRADGVARSTARAAGRGGPSPFADRIAAAMGADGAPVSGPRIRFGLTGDRRWPFPTYPAHLIEAVPADWIAGRAVIIGAVTPFRDQHVTPLRFASLRPPSAVPDDLLSGDSLPGAVVHAYALAQRLDAAAAPRLRPWREAVLLVLGALAGAALGGGDRAWWLKAVLLAGALALYGAAAFALFAVGGPLLGLAAFSSALITTGGLAVALSEHRQRRRTRFIRHAFEHYLAPGVVEELVRDPAALALAAREREISVLFSDIEGFTRFVDQTDRALVADVINRYLDRMMAVVLDHDGAVDKIVGDSLHALFSAPVEDADHRRKAVRCALAMQDAARALAAEFAARGVAFGRTRVGVHAGRALVGNFGGSRRFDYTAHGSTINIAARLEAANKRFGTSVCVSAAARAEDVGVIYRTVGDVLLRGLEAPIPVF
ncbi:MAG: CHASE2 domain-containing protein, partial [Caulobacterales bacterium]|nr:CHASE2 domain-containing protein [Caulobacterales bacterium]